MSILEKLSEIEALCERAPDDCPAFLNCTAEYIRDAENFYAASRELVPKLMKIIRLMHHEILLFCETDFCNGEPINCLRECEEILK